MAANDSSKNQPVTISATIGKVIDMGLTDPFNMGGAMAPAAAMPAITDATVFGEEGTSLTNRLAATVRRSTEPVGARASQVNRLRSSWAAGAGSWGVRRWTPLRTGPGDSAAGEMNADIDVLETTGWIELRLGADASLTIPMPRKLSTVNRPCRRHQSADRAGLGGRHLDAATQPRSDRHVSPATANGPVGKPVPNGIRSNEELGRFTRSSLHLEQSFMSRFNGQVDGWLDRIRAFRMKRRLE